MRAYLVRHGQAKSKDENPERHLTQKGAEDVRAVACFLAGLKLDIREVWHSGKTRAAETAEVLGKALSAEIREAEGLEPNDPPKTVRRAMEDGDASVMLVGHLPHMERLASSLVGAEADAEVVGFATAAVCCLERDEDGAWHILWMITPALAASAHAP